MREDSRSGINIHANTRLHLSRSELVDLPAVSCRVLLKQHFAQDLEEMKGQYIWSVRWYGLIERVQLPKPTRPSLSLALHPAKPSINAGFCSYLLTYEEIGTTSNPRCSARRVNTISGTRVLIQATVHIPACAFSTSSKPERRRFASSVSS